MKILYIDTSSSYLYSAILEDTKVLAEVKKEFGTSLSEESLPEIAILFEKANLKPKEIEKIIVVNGPGSFTGIRIGITIAKTYAWALNIDIITVNALEAMSISCKEETNNIVNYDPDISKIVEKTMDRTSLNPHAVNPEYLKLTEAEESKLNDNRV